MRSKYNGEGLDAVAAGASPGRRWLSASGPACAMRTGMPSCSGGEGDDAAEVDVEAGLEGAGDTSGRMPVRIGSTPGKQPRRRRAPATAVPAWGTPGRTSRMAQQALAGGAAGQQDVDGLVGARAVEGADQRHGDEVVAEQDQRGRALGLRLGPDQLLADLRALGIDAVALGDVSTTTAANMVPPSSRTGAADSSSVTTLAHDDVDDAGARLAGRQGLVEQGAR